MRSEATDTNVPAFDHAVDARPPGGDGAGSAWGARGVCLAAALLWSTSGLFIKPLTRAAGLPAGWGMGGQGWPGLEVAGLRSLIAFPLLLVLSGRRRLPRGGEVVVAACMAVTMITYSLAQACTATANAILLQHAAPLYVLALSPALLGERPRLRDLLTAPPIVAGLILIFISVPLAGGTLFGNLMGALSGLSYAGVVMSLRKWHGCQAAPAPSVDGLAGRQTVRCAPATDEIRLSPRQRKDGQGRGNLTGLAWGNAIAAAVALPLAPVLEGPLVLPTASGWAMILWLGLVQIGLAYFLFERATRTLRAAEASLIALIEPVACPVWTLLALGERPAGLAVAGGAAILVTLAAYTLAASACSDSGSFAAAAPSTCREPRGRSRSRTTSSGPRLD